MRIEVTIDQLYDLDFFLGELRRAIKRAEAEGPNVDSRVLDNIEALKGIIEEMKAEGMQ